jgi:hypothetical protein
MVKDQNVPSTKESKLHARVAVILHVMKEVERSPLSVHRYFQEHTTPFSRPQYYLYKKALEEYGIQGLYDRRTQGNAVKFTTDMRSFVKGRVEYNRSMPSSEVQEALEQEFGVTMSLSTITDFRRKAGLQGSHPVFQESGAAELLIALALESGFIDTFTEAISHAVQQQRASAHFEHSRSLPLDHAELRAHGRFTSAYNHCADVNASRFQALEDKVGKKRLVSMGIFTRSKRTLTRYTLALLSLPLVTVNGRIQSIDNPRGNALAYLCGYNYKAATLSKYLSELKYLQMADELLMTTARFWINFWSSRHQTTPLFACYYLDGNTKALWSSKSCHKGRVTMLGRVMNCLEQVFIHDGYGHPIYFQTFNGHADLGKQALQMLDRISGYLNEASPSKKSFTVNRILIFDGGGNGVRALRGLCQSNYHFITILDANQVTARKLKCVSDKKRYEYGEAYVVESVIELEDSSEKGYLFETRAVQVHWDNQRKAVLITSLSKDRFSPDNVVKSYFDRWPMQELTFKDMKSSVNIHRVVGYGKKSVDNVTVVKKIDQLQTQIQHLEETLADPLQQLQELEDALHIQINEERTYREQSRIVNGKRSLSEDDARIFKGIQKNINRLKRKIATLKQADATLFTSLQKKRTELARIIDKQQIYRVDVELDQIMTCFKISFANICCYLLMECFEGEKMTLQRLFETIFELRGQMRIQSDQRQVLIQSNPKQKTTMKKLTHAFDVINHRGIEDINGYRYHFQLV